MEWEKKKYQRINAPPNDVNMWRKVGLTCTAPQQAYLPRGEPLKYLHWQANF